nr:PREDICTED: DNA polymerase epsilon subunit 2 [Latimeria chalumnae]|eukprot:XP_014343291.1 PREDICTED: DNA polymerase epsilon subunit 2 [Latimeria chalumnae]
MASNKIKSKVTSAFKMHGFILRAEASKYLLEVLGSVNDLELEDVIERIIDAVEKQPYYLDRSINIRKSDQIFISCGRLLGIAFSIQRMLLGLRLYPAMSQWKGFPLEGHLERSSPEASQSREHVFNIIGVFDVPRYVYSSDRKKFLPLSMTDRPVPNLCGSARDKAELFRERYTILQQRTHRHELFTPPVIGVHSSENGNKFQLKTIETLLGSTAKVGEVIVLGMITQLKEGKYFLEDTTGAVQLDLSKAQFHSGLYTESCFVLAEGWYEDGLFHVNAFGFPPTEPSSTTRSYYGNINFFGGPSSTSVKASAKLKQLEEENEDAMFVFVSDLWLDQVEVLEKLHTMFSGRRSCSYPLILNIFKDHSITYCLIYTSQQNTNAFVQVYYAIWVPPPPCKHTHTPKKQFNFKCLSLCFLESSLIFIFTISECLKVLADIICEYPNIHKSSRFVFVPGPEDPGPSTILPRPPLAEHVTEDFSQRVPFSVFSTNPCRIQYCTQEIVIFREDLVNKMCRNCVRFPSNNLDIPNHFVKTILSQGHLTPLPLFVSPVYWAYDYTMRVYPVPDVVVIADKYDPFNITHTECICINPGSFPRSGFSFKVYYPSNKTVEESKLQGL